MSEELKLVLTLGFELPGSDWFERHEFSLGDMPVMQAHRATERLATMLNTGLLHDLQDLEAQNEVSALEGIRLSLEESLDIALGDWEGYNRKLLDPIVEARARAIAGEAGRQAREDDYEQAETEVMDKLLHLVLLNWGYVKVARPEQQPDQQP